MKMVALAVLHQARGLAVGYFQEGIDFTGDPFPFSLAKLMSHAQPRGAVQENFDVPLHPTFDADPGGLPYPSTGFLSSRVVP